MSLSERFARRSLVAAAVLAGAVALSGCTVSPLYGPTAEGRVLSADLSSIAIDAPEGRIEQEIRNQLVFLFAGGKGVPAEPRYRMALRVNTSQSLAGVTPVETAPSYSVNVAVAYELTEIASGRIVARGVARGISSYDRSNQGFANVRARLDAENRAAATVADDIRIRIAAALVTGRG